MPTRTLPSNLVSIQVSIGHKKLGHGVSLQRIELRCPPVKSGHSVFLPAPRVELREQEVAGSNPATPTGSVKALQRVTLLGFLLPKTTVRVSQTPASLTRLLPSVP